MYWEAGAHPVLKVEGPCRYKVFKCLTDYVVKMTFLYNEGHKVSSQGHIKVTCKNSLLQCSASRLDELVTFCRLWGQGSKSLQGRTFAGVPSDEATLLINCISTGGVEAHRVFEVALPY